MTLPSVARTGPRVHQGARPEGRRLLLISYHFPPSREVGAVRWQRLAKYAVERGWELDVVTLDPASQVAPDWDALADLPARVNVYGVPQRALPVDRLVQRLIALRRRLWARSPARGAAVARVRAARRSDSISLTELRSPLHSARDVLRAFHVWRDYVQGMTWSHAAGRVARRLLRTGAYGGVVSCGPPHWVHDAGRMLRQSRGLPLIIDMRDPWSLTPVLQEPVASPLWLFLSRRHERRAVAAATLIITNTEHSRDALQAAYPDARERIIAIMNGYDEDPLPPKERADCFIIAYAGSIYLDRDPHPLLRAAARVIREAGLRPDQLRLEFMGAETGHRPTLAQLAEQEGIGDYVRAHAARPRAEAKQFLARAAMLVSFSAVGKTGGADPFIPAKVFEYARFHAWLLALANPGSATAALLDGTGADVVPPHDVDGIAAVIRARYAAFARGTAPERPRLPERYSRRAQAQLLFDELERRLPACHAAPR
ncbi:MAG TPA: hypothetical protein VN964_11770 [Gemmatimonadales bacterium]|nr:hypothetical protein [Gemmatimonadales bacterium]